MISKILTMLMIILMLSGTAFAGRPLITDDTGTQGKGKYLLELSGEYSQDSDESTDVKKKTFTTEIDYGISDTIDLTVSSSYQAFKIKDADSGDTTSPDRMADTLMELKWRFYENKDGLSFAVKPGIYIPTGNYTKGYGGGDVRFGTGEVRYRLYFVSTKEFKRAAFHLNLGYMRNEAKFEARKNLLHASLAGELKITEKLRIAGNIGVDTCADTDSNIDPLWLLGGFVYSFTDTMGANFGVKHGLNAPGYDLTYTGGVSIKF
jgi:hypothetical protein